MDALILINKYYGHKKKLQGIKIVERDRSGVEQG